MDGRIVWSPGVTLEHVEQQVIERAYEHFRSNKTQTARALDISVRTLDERLEKYEIARKQEEEAYAQRKADNEEQLRRARGILPSIYDNDINASSSEARLQPEPAQNAPAQQSVPVSQRPEIQEVLSRQAGGHRARGSR